LNIKIYDTFAFRRVNILFIITIKTEEVFQETRRNCHTLVVYHDEKFLNTFAYSTNNYQHFALIYLQKMYLTLFCLKLHLITKLCIV